MSFPVAERLNKGLIAAWSPTIRPLGGEMSFPVAQRLNKGLIAAWSPKKLGTAQGPPFHQAPPPYLSRKFLVSLFL
eukprot:172687-Prorocentrum_minimum.AAC.1